MARSIFTRMKRAWAAASPGTACPSAPVAVVPDTRMRSPIRTARAYPASASQAVPVSTLARVGPPPRWGRVGAGWPGKAGVSIAGPGLRAARSPTGSLGLELRLELVDVRGGHLAGRLHVAVLDPPEPERTGDVAEPIELDRADDADVPDGLALLQEAERLPELGRSRVDHRAAGIEHLADCIADRRRLGLSGLRDREAQDRRGVV